MQILVLDTIHGGAVLGDALCRMGHSVDLIDVYRGDCSHPGSISEKTASSRRYDLLVHPVHLDPSHPLLRSHTCPAITHHEAVRWILSPSSNPPTYGPHIEITGARGKTSTATALASLMKGTGILHTSRGICRYPGEECITRMSITPASLIPVYSSRVPGDWSIAEISLGFTGLSDLAILTSDEDYRVAGGKLSALEIKERTGHSCGKILVPPGMNYVHNGVFDTGEITRISGTSCSYAFNGITGSFENPLLAFESYQNPLRMAAAAALILGYLPDKLSEFSPLPGRMNIITEDGVTILDNASTGACLKTTRDAQKEIKKLSDTPYTLVIGQEARAVCENFPDDDICTAIKEGKPAEIILVGGDERMDIGKISEFCQKMTVPITITNSLTEGMQAARNSASRKILVSVKTWR
ncbi:MAG: coenzyme F430 synthase [Methanospirillum sp.]|uniref:coenzyme F430 synthase n=1 Tax=Methanospirillum sp. TaxID=45200 RepID=UPI00237647F4|nr:coenzyme F430 synthase [Methanospirillum sp.]MDD1729442.1 coenzyme F430 synthase [Methanospirillum sp.]